MAEPSTFLKQNEFAMKVVDLSDNGWTLASTEILRLSEKIEFSGVPLREYLEGKEIYYGIKTGLNDAFVIDADKREDLIMEDGNCEELIKPWLRGRDVRRWLIADPDLYLISMASSSNVSWPWSSEKTVERAEIIFSEVYPAIYRHLFRFADKLKHRRDQGDFFWELRSCGYYDYFKESKIIYPIIGQEMRAFFDNSGYLTNDKCFIIPYDYMYITALFNSKILDLWFRLFMPFLDDPFNGGDMEFRSISFAHTPIAMAEMETKRHLDDLVTEIQCRKRTYPNVSTLPLEEEIDSIAYSLYGLNKKDIDLINKALQR